jgi:branched-chain amino acid transport system permease protein
MSLFLRELVRLKYPGALSELPFPTMLPSKTVSIGGVDISYISIFIVALAIALMLLLEGFIRRSRTGRAMRAVAQDPDTAKLMGVDVDRIIVITFAIGGALAAVGGVMQGAKTGAIDPFIGFIAGLKAFTAAVLGGIGNVTGAAIGGFIIGIVEAMATQYIPSGSTYAEAWVFVVLILVLVFRPTGILGEDVAVRA